MKEEDLLVEIELDESTTNAKGVNKSVVYKEEKIPERTERQTNEQK